MSKEESKNIRRKNYQIENDEDEKRTNCSKNINQNESQRLKI